MSGTHLVTNNNKIWFCTKSRKGFLNLSPNMRGQQEAFSNTSIWSNVSRPFSPQFGTSDVRPRASGWVFPPLLSTEPVQSTVSLSVGFKSGLWEEHSSNVNSGLILLLVCVYDHCGKHSTSSFHPFSLKHQFHSQQWHHVSTSTFKINQLLNVH